MIRFRLSVLLSALLMLYALTSVGPATAADTRQMFIWPTTGRITQPFGCTGFRLEPRQGSCRHFHGGIDIANRRGTPIHAADDGVVTHVGWDPWGMRNWMVMIKHGGGFTTWYAHMRGRHIDGIKKGVRVRRGELVGYMDTTGRSTGPHLHWAVLKNGSYVNPMNYVPGTPNRPRDIEESAGGVSCPVALNATERGAVTAFVMDRDDGSGGAAATCAA